MHRSKKAYLYEGRAAAFSAAMVYDLLCAYVTIL